MIFLLRLTSNITDLRRASNSPRYFDPEVKRLRSKTATMLSCIRGGTAFCIIRTANPSAIAVLPTPASPSKTGLFFVLRPRICTTR